MSTQFCEDFDEVKISESEAVEKLVQLCREESEDLAAYSTFVKLATQTNRDEKFINWLTDARFGPHVRLIIYISSFSMNNYMFAQTYLDGTQTDRDLCDYLCNHISERTFEEFRNMMILFLELNGRFMSFDYTKQTCDKIVDILEHPERYSVYQVRCASLILRCTYYRFEVVKKNENEFFQKLAEKWKTIVVDTDDVEMCEESLYFVFYRGKLQDDEYLEITQDLLKKHPNDIVTLRLYKNYLKTPVMYLAHQHLMTIKDSADPELWKEMLSNFCTSVMSADFLTSIKFVVSNELVQFCVADTDVLRFSAEALFNDSLRNVRVDAVDLIVSLYLNPLSDNKTKSRCLNILLTYVRPSFAAGYKEQPEKCIATAILIARKLQEQFLNNGQNDFVKVRCAQALALLNLPFTDNAVRKVILSMTLNEVKNNSENGTVRQLLLFSFLRSLKSPIYYDDLSYYKDQVETTAEFAYMYLSILYYAIPTLICCKEELQQLSDSVLPFLDSSDKKTQLLAKMAMERNRDTGRRKFNEPEVGFERVDETQKLSVLGADYIFLKHINDRTHLSFETILYSIPKLNKDDYIEWKDIQNNCYDFLVCRRDTNDSEIFKETVDQFIN